MARGLASAINQAIRESEREARRQHAQAIRNEQVAYKQHVAAVKADYIESRQAEAQQLNAALEQSYAAIDGILAATINVDDFFDLKQLHREAEHPAFFCPEFNQPTAQPETIHDIAEPSYKEPSVLWSFLGKKRKELEVTKSLKALAEAQAKWRSSLKANAILRQEFQQKFEQAEQQRLANLERAREIYANECSQREKEVETFNLCVDQLVSDLSYGTAEAVETYLKFVFERSSYPTSFPVSHELNFDPMTGELSLKVSVPLPNEMSTIKAYRYVKKNDEIAHSQLSQKAKKDRYASAVHQVAIRSIHEVFEADRRATVKTVAIEVGTTCADPATGIVGFMPFVAVASERSSFLAFDLAAVVPSSTLKHLGASLSKNPFGLVAAVTTGVRSV